MMEPSKGLINSYEYEIARKILQLYLNGCKLHSTLAILTGLEVEAVVNTIENKMTYSEKKCFMN